MQVTELRGVGCFVSETLGRHPYQCSRRRRERRAEQWDITCLYLYMEARIEFGPSF
jgi:hypothetical protein